MVAVFMEIFDHLTPARLLAVGMRAYSGPGTTGA